MSDWPRDLVYGNAISTISPESLGGQGYIAAAWASSAWTSNNRAYYVPFVLSVPTRVTGMFVANGATASGNIDLGIYRHDLTRVVAQGSVAQAGTAALQFAAGSFAATALPPGRYYMALSMSSTVGTVLRTTTTSTLLAALGMFQEAAAVPLPATATPVTQANSYLPLFGLILQGGRIL